MLPSRGRPRGTGCLRPRGAVRWPLGSGDLAVVSGPRLRTLLCPPSRRLALPRGAVVSHVWRRAAGRALPREPLPPPFPPALCRPGRRARGPAHGHVQRLPPPAGDPRPAPRPAPPPRRGRPPTGPRPLQLRLLDVLCSWVARVTRPVAFLAGRCCSARRCRGSSPRWLVLHPLFLPSNVPTTCHRPNTCHHCESSTKPGGRGRERGDNRLRESLASQIRFF